MAQLEDLPDEMLEKVFSYLKIGDLIHWGHVSQRCVEVQVFVLSYGLILLTCWVLTIFKCHLLLFLVELCFSANLMKHPTISRDFLACFFFILRFAEVRYKPETEILM